jgi:SAM-dependent methyltransferase
MHRLLTKLTRIARIASGGNLRARARMSPAERQVVDQIKARRLTYLSDSRLESIISTVREIVAQGIPGDLLEAGCALGGSTILIARLKEEARKLRVYDVFDTIPAPTNDDPKGARERYEVIRQGKSAGIGGDRYYGYETDLYERVAASLAAFGVDRGKHNVELIKGLIQETLVVDAPVAFAHIDVDWYEPVRVSLERIVPHLAPGGVLIVDDYGDWSGCRRATDEFFSDRMHDFKFNDSAGSLKITRCRHIRDQ